MCVCVCVLPQGAFFAQLISTTYKKDGAYGLGRVSHVDWSIIPTHLCEIRQSSTVIKMEVAGEGASSESGKKRGEREIYLMIRQSMCSVRE